MPEISRKLPNRINLAHARRVFGRPSITASPRLDATGSMWTGASALVEPDGHMAADPAGHYVDLQDLRPLEENRDPWRTRIYRLGMNSWQRIKRRWAERRLMFDQVRDRTLPLGERFNILRAGRPLTDPEMTDLREEITNRQLQAFHEAQARLAIRRIRQKLTDLGFCDSSMHESRRVIRSEVEIGYAEVSPLAYVLYVTRFPHGVKSLDISSEDVCTDLSLSVGHPVRSTIRRIDNNIIGLIYTVEIAATLGVPNLCRFGELLPKVPPTAPQLAFLLGYSDGTRLKWVDLERMPHLLGGGETNGGKSNMMHVLTCSLISRNQPDTLRLLMIDLKFSGIEMQRYQGLPHLITGDDGSKPGTYVPDVPTGIATSEDQATKILEWALDEAERRGQMFMKAGARDLRQWNRRRPTRRLAYIVIICDELAQLRLGPDAQYTKRTYALLQKLLSQGRAAGISFVAFTQSGNKRVLDELSKINLPGRICFATPDASSSILFVGDASARGLTPAGRAIFKHGTEKFLVQTPLIQSSDISEVIANARDGKLTTRLTLRPVTPEEIIDWSIEHNQSSLGWRDLFAHFGGELQRIDQATLLQVLRSMEGQEYIVNDQTYKVLPAIGSRPRVLQHVGDAPNMAPAGPESQNTTQNTTADGLAIQPRRCRSCTIEVLDLEAVTCPSCGAPL